MLSLELFAGCGGLGLGVAQAGFRHVLVIENDPQASATLTANKKRRVRHFADWKIEAKDVRLLDYRSVTEDIDLVVGGPPCQPFSIGGKHEGPSDPRNMWPEAVRAVQELQPRAFLFENVRGLLRPAFAQYLDFLRLRLSWPEIGNKFRSWTDHASQLRRREKSGAAPTYRVVVQGINAADYGAPQKRHRAIVMGVRSDLMTDELIFPSRTHSREALLWEQRVSGRYWERHGLSRRDRSVMTEADRLSVKQLRARDIKPTDVPWCTVRDAIGDLPRPSMNFELVPNHLLHPGARVYPRHTGSTWDEPAKALKAGDHGVPGGENVLVSRSGAVRYFTLREMARLQGFPDQFRIDGSWKNPIRQLGNAVPVQVGRAFAEELRRILEAAPSRTRRRTT